VNSNRRRTAQMRRIQIPSHSLWERWQKREARHLKGHLLRGHSHKDLLRKSEEMWMSQISSDGPRNRKPNVGRKSSHYNCDSALTKSGDVLYHQTLILLICLLRGFHCFHMPCTPCFLDHSDSLIDIGLRNDLRGVFSSIAIVSSGQ
jgi:hypothetical protein